MVFPIFDELKNNFIFNRASQFIFRWEERSSRRQKRRENIAIKAVKECRKIASVAILEKRRENVAASFFFLFFVVIVFFFERFKKKSIADEVSDVKSLG